MRGPKQREWNAPLKQREQTEESTILGRTWQMEACKMVSPQDLEGSLRISVLKVPGVSEGFSGKS